MPSILPSSFEVRKFELELWSCFGGHLMWLCYGPVILNHDSLTAPNMRSPLLPVFPPEICDTFIHLLRDDRQALAACSVVSRDWLPASRSQLFRSIRVTSGNEEQFHQLMQSENETFIHHVRAVELHAPPDAGRGPFDDLREWFQSIFAKWFSRTSRSCYRSPHFL